MTRVSRREQIHIRDGENARRNNDVVQHGKVQDATGMWQRGESGLEPARPLEAIAADLGEAMAEAVYAPVVRLDADWDAYCERFGLCGR